MTNHEQDKGQQGKQNYLKHLWNDIKENTPTAKFLLEVIALVVGGFYTHYASQQASAALTANRPYVGVDGVEYTHVGKNASGQYVTSPIRTNEMSNFNVRARIKNFGPVPGTNFIGRWKVFIGGIEQSSTGFSDRPYTIFPTQAIHLAAQIGSRDYPAIMSGEKTLALEVTVEYDGPGGHYRECSKSQYEPDTNDFASLGPLCTH